MKRKLQIILSIAVGIFLVWWLFRGTDWGELIASVREVKVGWLLLCEVVLFTTCFTRSQRWGYIVRVTAPVKFRALFSATQIGFLANFTLPARLGEAVRPLVLGRLSALPFSKCVAMAVLDRVTDVVGLMAIMLIAVVSFQPDEALVLPAARFGFPDDIPFAAGAARAAAVSTAAMIVIVIATLVILYVNEKALLRIVERAVSLVSPRLAHKTCGLLQHFADGLHVFRSASDMCKAILLSLVTWGFYLLSTVSLLNAFAIDWPWYAPFVMQPIVALGISIPLSVGFVGQFHAAFLIALLVVVPDVPTADATAFIIVADLANRVPIIVTGVFCLLWEHMGLFELSRQSTEAQAAIKQLD